MAFYHHFFCKKTTKKIKTNKEKNNFFAIDCYYNFHFLKINYDICNFLGLRNVNKFNTYFCSSSLNKKIKITKKEEKPAKSKVMVSTLSMIAIIFLLELIHRNQYQNVSFSNHFQVKEPLKK